MTIVEDQAAEIAQIVESIDVFWTLTGAVLVFYMQIGFSMLEVGSVSVSSTKNVLIKNTLDAAISAISWGVIGNALAFGDSINPSTGWLVGTTGFFFDMDDGMDYALWLFNWAFVATATTIVSGAVAERINFPVYIAFAFLLSILTYPVIVHWTWSQDGWMSPHREGGPLLFDCGVLDFAGSGVVHVTGGVAALIAVVCLGPRDNVSFRNGKKFAPAGQSDTLKTLGTLSLWFGWLSFNGASSHRIVGASGIAARAMVMTAMSGAVGGISSALIHQALAQRKGAKWDPANIAHVQLTPALNGILAGLVGITANCATVRLEGALVIGAVSGLFYNLASELLERFHIDDVVLAVPVHLACGLWGIVAAGFFTVPRYHQDFVLSELSIEAAADFVEKNGDELDYTCAGVFYGGKGNQLAANLVFLLTTVPWNLLTVGLLFYATMRRGVLRVTRLVELVGLDQMLHNDGPNHDKEDQEMEMTVGGAKARSVVPSGGDNALSASAEAAVAAEMEIYQRIHGARAEPPQGQSPEHQHRGSGCNGGALSSLREGGSMDDFSVGGSIKGYPDLGASSFLASLDNNRLDNSRSSLSFSAAALDGSRSAASAIDRSIDAEPEASSAPLDLSRLSVQSFKQPQPAASLPVTTNASSASSSVVSSGLSSFAETSLESRTPQMTPPVLPSTPKEQSNSPPGRSGAYYAESQGNASGPREMANIFE